MNNHNPINSPSHHQNGFQDDANISHIFLHHSWWGQVVVMESWMNKLHVCNSKKYPWKFPPLATVQRPGPSSQTVDDALNCGVVRAAYRDILEWAWWMKKWNTKDCEVWHEFIPYISHKLGNLNQVSWCPQWGEIFHIKLKWIKISAKHLRAHQQKNHGRNKENQGTKQGNKWTKSWKQQKQYRETNGINGASSPCIKGPICFFTFPPCSCHGS